MTEGLGAGSHPEVGRAAAEESFDEINDHLSGSHMVFITAGMGGGTGTGAAPVVARAAREQGILTVGVVTKPFSFEGNRRARLAEDGIDELHRHVDTLIVIPNQNLFRVANEKTTFADAFKMADQVLYSGVACITDLMVKEGLINLDFADVRAVMRGMGKAMMGTGEASGEDRARHAAEAAIANPLLDDVSMHGARGLADLDHRRSGPDALRSRRGGQPHPRGSRRGRQHHPRRHLRSEPRRHDPRVGGCHRHRRDDGAGARAGEGQPGRGRISVKRPHVRREQSQEARTGLDIESQVEAAVAEAITEQEPVYGYNEDDGVMVEPYIPVRREHGSSTTSRRSPSSPRFRASTCRPTPSVPTGSVGCPARRSFRLLHDGHRRHRNDRNRSPAMPARCSSGWPPMWASTSSRSTSPRPTKPPIPRPTMRLRAAR